MVIQLLHNFFFFMNYITLNKTSAQTTFYKIIHACHYKGLDCQFLPYVYDFFGLSTHSQTTPNYLINVD
jgi:hypothetical protein